jgi:hypothetical protein
MTGDNDPEVGTESLTATSNRVGLYSAILTAITTFVTFSLAIAAVPNSGTGCRENCFEYPYVNTLSEFPRDYLWIPFAMLLVVVYVILMVSIHTYAAQHKKAYSQVGLSFALIAAGILLSVLVVISIDHGLDRMDRFEVAVISIDWLVLVINGVLLSVLFRRQLKVNREPYRQLQS